MNVFFHFFYVIFVPEEVLRHFFFKKRKIIPMVGRAISRSRQDISCSVNLALACPQVKRPNPMQRPSHNIYLQAYHTVLPTTPPTWPWGSVALIAFPAVFCVPITRLTPARAYSFTATMSRNIQSLSPPLSWVNRPNSVDATTQDTLHSFSSFEFSPWQIHDRV